MLDELLNPDMIMVKFDYAAELWVFYLVKYKMHITL